MRRTLISVMVALPCLAPATAAQSPVEKGRTGIPLTEIMKPWTGDMSGMVERRIIYKYYVSSLLIQGEYLQRRSLKRGARDVSH